MSAHPAKEFLEKIGVRPAEPVLQYMDTLFQVNEKVNLTGAKNAEDFLLKHVADSWLANKVFEREHPKEIVDVGSGGGVPGVLLAFFHPQAKVTLVERRVKKAGALKEITDLLQLGKRIEIAAQPFEEVLRSELKKKSEFWFRGFMPGAKLAEYFSKFFSVDDLKTIVLMKGPAWPEEKEEIKRSLQVKREWKQRFERAREIEYVLPQDAGKRILVII